MMRCLSIAGLGVCLIGAAAFGRFVDDEPDKAKTVKDKIDFAHDIAPVLREHCGKCHTGDQQKGGFSLNTRETLLAGGELGKSVVPGDSGESELLDRLTTDDETFQMPPPGEGARVPADKVELIKAWIDEGLPWEDGFTFGKRAYEPKLNPRRPELPPAIDGRDNPIDRIIDAYLTGHNVPSPQPIDDATFARRAYLDIIGLLPTPDELQTFLSDARSDKRSRLTRALLDRNVDYAEHWLTFWNDLLRNDYAGTGFITGGRKQISRWLYEALATNKPYDQFARELIAPPTPESVGFIEGIKWRGDVSAGQTVEIQFAQSLGQSFLGINLKCASCHDSFIDRWKLDESYGLAAIYATRDLEIHRCDKPIGKKAAAAWLFPELGRIDPEAPQPERLKQLAGLMTHPQNGRFTRTIANRFWHRLMGRGIVHPVDAMQTEPWSEDLLDYLGVYLADQNYDLKKIIELIVTSQAYQSHAEVVSKDAEVSAYVYSGPRAKRMTAEQFVDVIWQLTESAPSRYDAPVVRGKFVSDSNSASNSNGKAAPSMSGKWIWSYADASKSPAGETVTFRKTWELKQPGQAMAVVSCDNSYTLYVNGKAAGKGDNWEQPDSILLTPHLKEGANEIMIVARNAGNGPNPAALFCEARSVGPEGATDVLATDGTWEWTKSKPGPNGQFRSDPKDWQSAAPVANPGVWARVGPQLDSLLEQGAKAAGLMVRASLLKSDFFMRSLGRPNRDQIVTVRPQELTTLEAIDLSNGQVLADTLEQGSKKLLARSWESPVDFVRWLYRFALSRDPSDQELRVLTGSLGDAMTEQNVQDVLWTVVMLPEFQLVR